ncbi:TRAP-type C4-dicarboxylate transport system, substrate-binding protein [Enhydrobacter aerosaccus]|uniref:TRAP-type C4-dicarboxylate transport system, substrate-binding protein n=1 Tax=Enhydrobacter aerosaccus TaxID=225324 RepID=A0A1T4T2R0_9HYPH|nr:TRAP transporter substrate-binding protein DctP [Enhydrobacter aerosaccus]SKA34743.1 TRAP-type C4-dicarboxylate transport system, substrate-binding protein [Enhydrobacter aerosaccus]
MINGPLTRRQALTVLAAGTVAAPAVLRAQSPTTWIVYTYVPAATLAPARVMAEIVERVAKETNGQLQLKYHLGGALTIKGTDITTAVGDNVIQMGDDGMQQGNVPVTGILRLPMLLTTPQEFDKALAVMKPYVDKGYDKLGATVLATYYYPLQFAWSTKKLTGLDDFKGQKIRATSPEQIEFLKRFGASGLTVSAAEVPSALERGVVDGVLTAHSGGGRTWHDLLKYTYDLGINFFEANLVVNKEAYAKLPPPQRDALTKAVVDLAPQMTKLLFEDEETEKAKRKAEGMIQTAATPDDYKRGAKAMEDYWDAWAKRHGAQAQEALKKVRDAVGR